MKRPVSEAGAPVGGAARTGARRYRMDVAYDGADYAGWQVQPGAATIQGALEEALGRVAGHVVKVHGSGRTDRGVHARCQPTHFELDRPFDPATLRKALNALLPAAIRVLRVARARPDFHARRHALEKEYRYFIWNGDPVPPFLARYRAQVRAPLAIGAMRAAAALLEGRRDFAAFSANPNREVGSTVRSLYALRVTRRGKEIVIVARGEGFLYKMVRSLAGWLIRVGEGAARADDTVAVLLRGERTARVPTAPGRGLFLWRVRYASARGGGSPTGDAAAERSSEKNRSAVASQDR